MLPRWLITFRALALASAFAAAFVPIATYITDDKRDWLWIHIGVNIAAYIAVALTTIYTTISLTQQDHNKYRVPAYWSNNVVMRTWWLGVSKTWRWHVAAAVGRLGLALALAQHLHFIDQIWGQDFAGIIGPFLYASRATTDGTGIYTRLMIYPQWETICIAAIVMIGFAALETELLTSLTLFGYSFSREKSRAVVTAVAIRVGIIVVFVITMLGVHELFSPRDPIDDMYPNIEFIYVHYSPQDTLKDFHKLAFTWLDDGTMLSVWMMRPVGADSFHACQASLVSDRCVEYDNRAWVLIDILHAVLSAMIYLFVTGIILCLAHYLHWRREQRETPTPAPTTP